MGGEREVSWVRDVHSPERARGGQLFVCACGRDGHLIPADISQFPGHRENEYQRFEGLGMPSEYIDDVYVAHAVHAQLADMWSLPFPRKTRSGSSICRGHRIDPGSPGVHSREVTCMPESV